MNKTISYAFALVLLMLQLACDLQTAEAIQLYASRFQRNSEGFVYADNTFYNTTTGAYASGKFVAATNSSFGYIQVQLGGVDNLAINRMSGGWIRAFTLPQTSTVTINLRFQIIMNGEYESDELSQALLSVDGKIIGPSNSTVFLGQTIGTSTAGTPNPKPKIIDGYRWVTITAENMNAGNHSITLGGFNNKKTWSDEFTQIRFSNVTIDYIPTASTNAPVGAPVPSPTKAPTKNPTKAPVRQPTKVPTKSPTKAPTKVPTKSPTKAPTKAPTKNPTKAPTKEPTKNPTQIPVRQPTKAPTKEPTIAPMYSATQTPVPPPGSSPPFAIRINTGSATSFVDPSSGAIWEPDQYFGNKGAIYGQCPKAISGTDMDELYCKERYFNKWHAPGPYRYEVPVPRSATYTVRLHFAEIYYTTAQQRVFDVWINGELVIGMLDIFAEVGHAASLVINFNTAVRNSVVTVEFVPRIENPKICGIEITEIGEYVAPPTAAPFEKPFQKLINCGGVGFVDNSGSKQWEDDQHFIGGNTYADGSNDVSGTKDQALYQTERNGEFTYEIPVPVGSYEIVLHFAELYWQGTGQRLFNIEIEGVTAFTNVDIVALGGGKRLQAFTLEAPTIVSDGFVSLAFKDSNPKIDAPKLSGIEINFLSPHLAHSDADGPYIATDVYNRGSVILQLDGSFSHTHGTGLQVVEWLWKKESAVIATGPMPNVTLPVGEHTIYLEIKDSGNNKATDTTTVTVNPYGYPAVLGIEPSVGSISGGQLVTIQGSGFDYAASTTKVKFGLTELTGDAITIIDPFTIQVRSPPAVIGTPVPISVETTLGVSNSMLYTYQAASPINFLSDVLVAAIPSPTSVEFGPDGYLYVGTLYGKLARLKLDDTYTTVVSSVIATIDPYRAILGITFDPMSTSDYSDVYITTSFFFHGDKTSSSGQSINGVVKKVSGANLDTVTAIVTGLPVSDHDHGTFRSETKKFVAATNHETNSWLLIIGRVVGTGIRGQW